MEEFSSKDAGKIDASEEKAGQVLTNAKLTEEAEFCTCERDRR